MSIAVASTRARLRRFKGRFPEICRNSGLQYSWLSKFASGERGKQPSFDLLSRLQKALDGMEASEAKDEDGQQAEGTQATN